MAYELFERIDAFYKKHHRRAFFDGQWQRNDGMCRMHALELSPVTTLYRIAPDSRRKDRKISYRINCDGETIELNRHGLLEVRLENSTVDQLVKRVLGPETDMS